MYIYSDVYEYYIYVYIKYQVYKSVDQMYRYNMLSVIITDIQNNI